MMLTPLSTFEQDALIALLSTRLNSGMIIPPEPEFQERVLAGCQAGPELEDPNFQLRLLLESIYALKGDTFDVDPPSIEKDASWIAVKAAALKWFNDQDEDLRAEVQESYDRLLPAEFHRYWPDAIVKGGKVTGVGSVQDHSLCVFWINHATPALLGALYLRARLKIEDTIKEHLLDWMWLGDSDSTPVEDIAYDETNQAVSCLHYFLSTGLQVSGWLQIHKAEG